MYMLMYIDNMSQRYSIADARSHLPAIINRAQAGQEIELTRRGKSVAVIVSCEDYERLRGNRPRFSEAYRNFLKKHSLKEIGLDEGFAAVSRDKSPGRKVSL
jgi:prevent-host-death family protein